ncbi:cytochrome b/b6 domain-containing protein [Luteimonas sp. TWI1437]|uniref:cytochrome b n=1 Tax=unclassified Luteimonas TaxID=2629088 RepID=UPI0032083662
MTARDGSPAARAPAARYSPLARALHWVVALLVPIQLGLGWIAEHSPAADGGMRMLRWHYQLGMLLLLAMLLRLATRLARGVPKAQPGQPRWQRRIAQATHVGFYLLLCLLPASGYIVWVWMGAPMDVLGTIEVPRMFRPPADDERGRAIAWYLHVFCAWSLAALIVLHVAAVLWHGLVRRDGLIRQMW